MGAPGGAWSPLREFGPQPGPPAPPACPPPSVIGGRASPTAWLAVDPPGARGPDLDCEGGEEETYPVQCRFYKSCPLPRKEAPGPREGTPGGSATELGEMEMTL